MAWDGVERRKVKRYGIKSCTLQYSSAVRSEGVTADYSTNPDGFSEREPGTGSWQYPASRNRDPACLSRMLSGRRQASAGKAGLPYYKSACYLGIFSTLSEKYLVLDISPNGLHFITKTEPKEKASLLLTITAPLLNDRNIHLNGRVVWIKKSPELDAYRTGVAITGISDTHRNRLKLILDNAVLDKIDLSTRIYLKEVEKL